MRNVALKLFVLTILFFGAASAKAAVSANFSVDHISGCAPLVVSFTNSSTDATSYYWDLGNGTNSTLTNVSGSYLTAGTYTAVLTANNGSASSTHTVTITVYAAPVVSFTASDTSVCPGTSISFNSTSSPGVPGPLTYIWNFGDGSTGTSASPSHTYSTPGYYNITLSVTNSQGCVTTTTVSSFVHIFTPPVATVSATPSYFCHAPGHAVFVSNTTGTGAFTYSWAFGDGGTSAASAPTHDYVTSGTYLSTMTVVDANGCTNAASVSITVGTLHAAFTLPATACVFTPVTFINTTGTPTVSTWTFGDGSTATSDTGRHTYSAPGTYTVSLVVFNGFCYDTSLPQTITILPQPTGTLNLPSTPPCPAPTNVTFTGTVATGTGIVWNFGDGGTGTGTPVSHNYTSNGNYNVQMIITNSSGCKDTIDQVFTLTDLHLVVATNPLSPSGCAPLTVGFNASATTTVPTPGPYPSTISSYTWNYGDGSSTVTGTSSPTHTFTTAGTYSTVCTIVTANGCTAKDTIIISVGNVPRPSFTANPRHVCYGRPVSFFAYDSSGTADIYSWTWGDGATQADSFAVTSHEFADPGLYTVTLVVYDNGCPSPPYTWVDSFRVDSPKAIIAAAYHCDPYTRVTFVDNSLGNDAPLWFFGDGGTSTSDTPNHIYALAGVYTATLTTYNAASGCRDTTVMPLNLVAPILHIFADDTAVCSGDMIHFTSTVTGSTAVQNFWDVNGVCLNFDTSANFNYWFPTAGIFDIRYRIRDLHGCMDTVTRNAWILSSHPVAGFSLTPATGCAPLLVTFTDTSHLVPGTYLTNYKWNYGDGSPLASGGTPTVSHSYTAASSPVFNVKEIITDNIGCKDSVTRPAVTVWKLPAVFTVNLFPCINTSVHFSNTTTPSSSIVNSFWIFGDGDTLTAFTPNHTYTNYGTYISKLVVTDGHGCTDTASRTVTVSHPAAHFYMDDSFSICPPLPVHFTSTSTGATSYHWAFGDGAVSTNSAPNDLYTASGSYTVTFVAIDVHGCPDTAYGHVIVYGSAGGFTYTPLSGCSPLAVHFSAALNNVPNIVWDFADGNTFSTSMSDSTTHYYVNPGAYVPKLILSDNTGCQSSSLGLDTIKVDAVRPGFTTNPNPICLNDNVTFLDTSGSYFSTITSWNWDFGAAGTSTAASPTQTYNTVGSYPITLVVTDGWGCTGGITKNVVVNPPPNIDAGPDTTVCVTDAATLTATGGVSYTWLPTPVSCSPCQTTQVTPAVVTTYTVTGTDANGCVNTDTVTVHLRTVTTSGAWGDDEVCRNVPVPLFDTGGTIYTWIPAAGLSNATISNPIATPATTTTYTVIAQLGSCIPDTNFVTVIVHPLPTVDAGPDQRLVAGSHAQLQAMGNYIAHFDWTPNTLSCDTCGTPTANNLNTTTYHVTATSDFGCKAYDSVTIFLFCDESQIFIPNTFTPNGDGENDVFYPRGSGVSQIKTFRVYNRWGELLFERLNININDVSNAWDGTFNGGAARPDVYVYLIDALCDTGEPIFIKGDVTIIK